MIHVSRGADLEAACGRAAAARLHHLPLFRGAADGRHALAILSRPEVLWPAKIGKHLGPQVVLLGDDPYPDGDAIGPAGWACLRNAQRWARFVVVHGTGSCPDHYRLVAALAQIHRSVLMIETGSRFVEAWAARFTCPVMRFVPPPGGVHPSPVAEVMN